MNSPKAVFIFDIDGVLVKSLGYLGALQATMKYFIQEMGLDDTLIPTEDLVATFEAHRVTSEWDMIPLSLAIILNAWQAHNPGKIIPSRLGDLKALREYSFPVEIDYRAPLQRLALHLRPGEYPTTTALRLTGRSLDNPAIREKIFPYLDGSPLLHELLANTRDVEHSLVTRIFQHYTLGSFAYSQTYHLSPIFETPSLLRANDRPLLSVPLRDEILSRWARGELALAAYTMRPSLPPREINGNSMGYAPEAEIALDQVGLAQIPLISYGRIRFLAEQHNSPIEAYLKPSPVQALAAIFSALTRNEMHSLEIALSLFLKTEASSDNPPQNDLKALTPHFERPLPIYIFEDSLGGIEAVRLAGDILTKFGMAARIYPFGIATHPEKVTVLHGIGAPVFAEVNEAVRSALQRMEVLT